MRSSKTINAGKPRKSATRSRNWRQFFRYLLVGGSSFALEYGSFFLLLQVYQLHYLIANSIVYPTVSLLNFALNRSWTFNSKNHLGRQALLYLALIGFNFLAGSLLLYILSGQLQIPPQWAKIAVMVMIVLWNFILYKKVIYR